MIDRPEQTREDHDVFDQGRADITEGLGRGIDRYARSGLEHMCCFNSRIRAASCWIMSPTRLAS